MKAHRPPQAFAYYNAAMVAYYEGNNKQGDYLWLRYCQESSKDWDAEGKWKAYKPKTARQEEQAKLFSRLGMISRTISNLRELNYSVQLNSSKRALSELISYLDTEYNLFHQQMKTISERISND